MENQSYKPHKPMRLKHGKILCNVCKRYLDQLEFHPCQIKGQGYRCKGCARLMVKVSPRSNQIRNWNKANALLILYGMFQCGKCFVIKPIDEFYNDTAFKSGKSSSCAKCDCKYVCDYALTEKGKRQSLASSKRRKYRVREALRIAKAKARGFSFEFELIDEKFLEGLYSQVKCYYCQKDIPVASRTMDHLLPLSRGGPHRKDNCVMACKSCNCRKHDKTESEYWLWLKDVGRIESFPSYAGIERVGEKR